MTRDKRILLNVIATYTRTLFSIACGLFSVRWVLMALGHESYGLYGVVGSLSIFMNFLNVQLSAALSRFFAVSIGRETKGGFVDFGLKECQAWFSCGVYVHVFIPLVLVIAGWLIGSDVVRSGKLSIPSARIETCVWLWRFVCISSFVTMMSSPYNAMFVAKQRIAELTIYSVVQTLAKTIFIYCMTLVPIDWLWWYGFGICCITIVPQVAICYRAIKLFPECYMHWGVVYELRRMRQLLSYAWWQTFQGIGYIARHQCLELIVNKYFGPMANASYTVASTFSAEAASLTSAMNGAFGPAISTAYGAGEFTYMRRMAFRSCKIGTLLTLCFAVPMFVEVDEVLRLWLQTPPEWSSGLCMIMLCVVVVEKLTLGHGMAVDAMGDIALFKLSRGVCCLTAIPFSIVLAAKMGAVHGIALALLCTTIIVAISDVILARSRVRMFILDWIRMVVCPLFVLAIWGIMLACLPRLFLSPSFFRVCVSSVICVVLSFPMAWFIVLDDDERIYVFEKITHIFGLK